MLWAKLQIFSVVIDVPGYANIRFGQNFLNSNNGNNTIICSVCYMAVIWSHLQASSNHWTPVPACRPSSSHRHQFNLFNLAQNNTEHPFCLCNFYTDGEAQ